MKQCQTCLTYKPEDEFCVKQGVVTDYCTYCGLPPRAKKVKPVKPPKPIKVPKPPRAKKVKPPRKFGPNPHRDLTTKQGHVYQRFHSRKHHAKKHSLPFNVTVEYLLSIAPDTCPILGIPLSWCEQSSRPTENSPTIDRINPSLGYVIGNVAWMSNRANRIKNDGTAEEHLAIAKFMTNFVL